MAAPQIPDISLWDFLLIVLALPFSGLALAILTTTYIYYVSAVRSLIWRCFGKTGLKNKPPSNP